jgi:hypothetical protein
MRRGKTWATWSYPIDNSYLVLLIEETQNCQCLVVMQQYSDEDVLFGALRHCFVRINPSIQEHLMGVDITIRGFRARITGHAQWN